MADAEIIALGWQILQALGVAGSVVLELNTLGDAASRDAYRAALVAYFGAHRDSLSADSRTRLEHNPLRILDSKDAGDRALVADAPTIYASLTPEAEAFYTGLKAHLGRFRVPFVENPRIVRGLDYYSHTAFEFVTDQLGAQGTVMGGGRYDGLMQQMGGPAIPAVGWAAGVERLAMLLAAPPTRPAPVAVVPMGGEAEEAAAIAALQSLRQAGIAAEMSYRGNAKRRMERANKIGARAAVIIGGDELAKGVAQLRDFVGGGQEGGRARPVGGAVERSTAGAAEVSATLDNRLDMIVGRAAELRAMLSEGLGGEGFSKASKELSELEPVVERIGELRAAERAHDEAQAMVADPEMRALAEAELYELKDKLPALRQEIRLALLPKDEADARSAILEVRPAAGGDEAGLFAAELFQMYQKYAVTNGWRVEVLDYSDNELGGIKEAVAEITGRNVFARFKYESGVHRVQRVPATESQGRIHTSTVTVAVLPEAEEVDVEINESDLRIDVYRASGAGGQHVNKTESAVRITHIPSGVVVANAGGAEPAQESGQGDEDPAKPAVRGAALPRGGGAGGGSQGAGWHRRPERADQDV